MKTTVSKYDFKQAFKKADRKDNFSYEGLSVLFNYLEECDPDYELDVIALCCEYSEDDYRTIVKSHGIDVSGVPDDDEDDEALAQTVRDYLDYHTYVVGDVTGGFVYADF